MVITCGSHLLGITTKIINIYLSMVSLSYFKSMRWHHSSFLLCFFVCLFAYPIWLTGQLNSIYALLFTCPLAIFFYHYPWPRSFYFYQSNQTSILSVLLGSCLSSPDLTSLASAHLSLFLYPMASIPICYLEFSRKIFF